MNGLEVTVLLGITVLTGAILAPRLRVAGEQDYGPEVAEPLRRALGRLPASQREVVVLKQLRGLSFADIAARVGASEEACKMRFARGLEALRRDLEREGLEP